MQKWKAPPGRASILQEGIVKPCGPHQRTSRSGSVHALKTRARGASKTRWRAAAGPAVLGAGLFLAALSLPLPLRFARVVANAIEALPPKPPRAPQPAGGVFGGTRLEPAGPPLRLATARDQTGMLQHPEVLGDRGKAHREGLGQLRDRGLARAEASKDRAPGGIGQGREGSVEAIGRRVVNHQVNQPNG